MRVLLLLSVVAVALAASPVLPKRLAGPPSEFEAMRMPSPLKAALAEESALLPMRFAADASSHTQVFAVDSKTEFQLVLYTPASAELELELVFPNGTRVPNLDAFAEEGKWPVGSSGDAVTAPGWRFENPVRGKWTATISVKKELRKYLRTAAAPVGHPDAYLFLWNDSEERIFSHVGTYFWTTGQTVGIVANMFILPRSQSLVPSIVRPATHPGAIVTTARLDIYSPTGEETSVDMQDDGRAYDGLANDGVFGGLFAAKSAGMYRVTTLFEGTLEDGTPFMRSAEHAMMTVDDPVDIIPGALAMPTSQQASDVATDQLSIRIAVKGPEGLQVRTYAEVFGTEKDSGTTMKAACWIGGYSVIESGHVEFEVNKQWLAMAGVAAPLELRNVALFDGDVHIPLSVVSVIKVQPIAIGIRKQLARLIGVNQQPTEEMLKGKRPLHLFPAAVERRRKQMATNSSTSVPSLILLHGYCAKDNPWTRNSPVDFTNYVAFDGFLEKSVLNNVYAQKIIEDYGELPSWGLVGHSQGGLVALHLHNFYWTPNDGASLNSNGRVVQSIGTPYMGVSGTGAALDIGALFGLGCGDNFDLSTDGANLWQSGLQVGAKKDVFYYTTMWKKTFLHPRYCNLATNLVLDWPNDGLAELERSQLEGGNAVENPFEGECHTVNMKWPAQTQNVERNKEINERAAR